MKKWIAVFLVGIMIAATLGGCSSLVDQVAEGIRGAREGASALAEIGEDLEEMSDLSDMLDEAESSSQDASVDDSGDVPDDVAKPFADMFIGGKYMMKFRSQFNAEGVTSTFEATQWVSGNKVAIIGQQGGQNIKIIIRDGKAYLVDDTTKMIFEMPSPQEAEAMAFDAQGEFTYEGSGRETFGGRTLPFNQYKIDGGTMRMYVDGGKLVGIKTTVEGTENIIEILDFSNTVDEKVFELPSDYQTMSF